MKVSKINLLQKNWAAGVIAIGSHKGDVKEFAAATLRDLYDFESNNLAFKPTMCSEIQFRETFEGALSYFIGDDANFSEDNGFALLGWKDIKFENAVVKTVGNLLIAMGNYYLTNNDGIVTKVEYTFGYDENDKIVLHHSSFPYTP